MLQKLSEQIAYCYQSANECNAKADAVNEAAFREYYELERRWLTLARSYELSERITDFTSELERRGKIKDGKLKITVEPCPRYRMPTKQERRNVGRRRTRQLLSEGERARLAVISSFLRFKKGGEYCEGDNADASFNISSGVAKVYTQGPGNDELVRAFLFPEDVFGLAEEGR